MAESDPDRGCVRPSRCVAVCAPHGVVMLRAAALLRSRRVPSLRHTRSNLRQLPSFFLAPGATLTRAVCVLAWRLRRCQSEGDAVVRRQGADDAAVREPAERHRHGRRGQHEHPHGLHQLGLRDRHRRGVHRVSSVLICSAVAWLLRRARSCWTNAAARRDVTRLSAVCADDATNARTVLSRWAPPTAQHHCYCIRCVRCC
jgi:hypothetical protein